MKNPFTQHPHSVDETYAQHFWFAFRFSLRCFQAGIYALLHAVFPFAFTTAASEKVKALYAQLNVRD